MTVVLHFDPRNGWSLHSPQGAMLFGPTWSIRQIGEWADDNRAEVVPEEAPA